MCLRVRTLKDPQHPIMSAFYHALPDQHTMCAASCSEEAGLNGELGCLYGKAGTSHLCHGSAHSSGCVVNGSNAMAAF